MGRRGQGSGGSGAGGGARGGGGNARDLKMYLRHGLWREHSKALVAVAVLAAALFSGVVLRFATSPTLLHTVDATDAALVTRVFRSGEPWLVLCARADDVVPDVFADAAKRLAGRVHAGVLDCRKPLPLPPGAKSALQRYKISASVSPTVFTVANGGKPQQSPKALAKRALAQTKKSAQEVLNSAQLDMRCLQKAACVLLLRGRKYSPYEKQWLDKLQQKHRALQFAWLDATRLALSIESLLPEFVAGEHRMVLFRRSKQRGPGGAKPKGGVVTAKAYRNDFDAIPVDLFLKEHAGAELKALAKTPTISRRSALTAKKKTKKTKQRQDQAKEAERDSTSTTEQGVKSDDSDDDHFPRHATESEVASGGDAGDDDDDLEVLDLDADDE
ncbi:hypothetical protein PybrP1_000062 [[Pythium] brassicae (nom. inval.)]|nr:hypothetical protein PybrP1_000062 [[Pythium] brassicae (nom. inval.)]